MRMAARRRPVLYLVCHPHRRHRRLRPVISPSMSRSGHASHAAAATYPVAAGNPPGCAACRLGSSSVFIASILLLRRVACAHRSLLSCESSLKWRWGRSSTGVPYCSGQRPFWRALWLLVFIGCQHPMNHFRVFDGDAGRTLAANKGVAAKPFRLGVLCGILVR